MQEGRAMSSPRSPSASFSQFVSSPPPFSYLRFCPNFIFPLVENIPYPTICPIDVAGTRSALDASLSFFALLRVSELFALKWDVLNWSNGLLRVSVPINPTRFHQDLTLLCFKTGIDKISPHQLKAGGAMEPIRRGSSIEEVQRRGRRGRKMVQCRRAFPLP
ncbi:hypothetical protein PRIPAC_80879 [Pristionchus pacificus]|uniref:Uncharacterized protein n=1 Tax=Pristionchus pacificus TaxID=54126 RepID=A0A2A6BZ15_PRIPA|nr:hypothetical protein PRIPAC_80879 [Pristionchus pacificus]|eukprot:PDM71013.1 hypothetical protein PRIPAC_44409 [Pristionchus pacificus]